MKKFILITTVFIIAISCNNTKETLENEESLQVDPIMILNFNYYMTYQEDYIYLV